MVSFPIANTKILCCRPRVGLADSFAQISKCMIYAKAHNRRLWINAKSAGQLQRLTDYFLVHASSSKTIALTESLNQSLLNESYSSILTLAELRDLDSLFPVYDQVLNKHIDPRSKLVTTFDFNIDYPHDILLHEQCGSGPSWNVFERLVLTSKARISISERLRELPPRYMLFTYVIQI